MTTSPFVFSTDRIEAGRGPSLVVAHGGVDMEPVDATFLSLEAATTAALAELARGTDGITAALASVAVLEDDPRFNAGYGSVLTRAMTVETDGAVSSGRTGRFAGVGAVPGIRRPAALAHRIMQQEEVVLLVGTQAAEYAASLGIEIEDLVTPEQLQALRTQTDDPLTSVFTGRGIPSETVGCLTIDRLGEVSSASSTGGLLGKPPGRVGDACIPGGGYWTDERFGVLCSGSGEAAMSINLARTVATRAVEEGLASALENSLRAVTRSGRAVCAIVAVDALTGEVMTMHNGSSFPVSVRNDRATYRLGDPTREQSDERSRR